MEEGLRTGDARGNAAGTRAKRIDEYDCTRVAPIEIRCKTLQLGIGISGQNIDSGLLFRKFIL